jgi:hypothetical protein
MRRFAGLCLMIGMGWMSMTSSAQQAATEPRLETSFSYDYARAYAGPGQCGCFNMNGGSMEVAVHAYRGLSAVADLGGEWSGSLGAANGVGLSLSTLTAGPRYTQQFSGPRLVRYSPFVQGLVGGARGFGSLFPSTTGLNGSATSFALLAGGGVDVRINHYLSFRPLQVDYLRTQLPNGEANSENLLHVGAGLVLHTW